MKVFNKNILLIAKFCSFTSQILKAQVVAVGPGFRSYTGALIPCSVSLGDTVLLPEHGGTKVEAEEGVEMMLFRDSDILGKWVEES